MTDTVDRPPHVRYERIRIGGCYVDLRLQADVVDAIDIALQGRDPALAIASINLDHISHFGPNGPAAGIACVDSPELRWWVLLDGAPVAVAARLATGRAWPRLTGADLLAPVLGLARDRGARVGFLGGTTQMHAELLARLNVRLPGIAVAGTWAPDRRSLTDPAGARELALQIAAARVDLLVVGLGKPRQELWIQEHGPTSGARVLLAFGAAADFYSGAAARAPELVRRTGFEWAFRLGREPRRMANRYLIQGPRAAVVIARAELRDINSTRGPGQGGARLGS